MLKNCINIQSLLTLLRCDGFANTRQTGLPGFRLADSVLDDAFHEPRILADLPDTQTLALDHLNNLEFETRIKASSGFRILHVLRHLGSWKNPIVVSV